MTSEVWAASYPDLNGKAAVLAGTSSVLAEIARVFAQTGALCALVVNDRELVECATGHSDRLGLASMGIVADPTEAGTWRRIAPHIEQRLGPIDIVVAAGPPATRLTITSALLPDMAARRRGVIVEAGAKVEPLDLPTGLRHRAVSATRGVRAQDIAAAVVLCASDVLSALKADVNLAAS